MTTAKICLNMRILCYSGVSIAHRRTTLPFIPEIGLVIEGPNYMFKIEGLHYRVQEKGFIAWGKEDYGMDENAFKRALKEWSRRGWDVCKPVGR